MSHASFDLTGRLALITGSARGIGLAIAQGLAESGCSVILNGRTASTLDDARQTFINAGHTAHTSVFDVAEAGQVNQAVDDIEKTIGPIDILVNNAGLQRRGTLETFTDADWHELMRTNLDGVFHVARAVAQHMIPRQKGKIINICSVQSELGRPTIAPYTASKGAVKMLTKGMCIDWGPHNIQVNGLGPGYFKTELTEALVNDPEFTQWVAKRTPAGRWGEVQELQGAAVFLASDASSFVNGHILYVDGGMTASL